MERMQSKKMLDSTYQSLVNVSHSPPSFPTSTPLRHKVSILLSLSLYLSHSVSFSLSVSLCLSLSLSVSSALQCFPFYHNPSIYSSHSHLHSNLNQAPLMMISYTLFVQNSIVQYPDTWIQVHIHV